MVLSSFLMNALENPVAYPHPVTQVNTIITAVSMVFLTGNYAYKINKPLNLGFLDFSTLEKRKEQCEKELRYNSLISPELYISVVPITQNSNGQIQINGSGDIIEYALTMNQMDPAATMNMLLKQGKVTPQHITTLARKIFSFHQIAPVDAEIAQYGRLEAIQFNWNENFSQTEKYVPLIISPQTLSLISQKIHTFLDSNALLFEQRVRHGKIKHCHGDFHSGNVFITNTGIHIFDGIVFNQRFPCSDVIAEIAFMAMDLDFHGRDDLSRQFVQEYAALSNDMDIPALLDFYKCYRAYIRAKIACFTLEDPQLSTEKKEYQAQLARQYFELARRYASMI